ncbi:MAG: PH domain-containing protein [Haloferacaceae archaeon]
MATDYDWLSLDSGEEIVWTGQPRVRSVLGSAAGALAFVVVALVVLGGVAASGTAPTWMATVAGALAVLYGAAQVGWAYLRVTRTHYVLTTENLYRRDGVFSETVNRVGVEKIQRTTLSKGLLGNLFDYGTVDVSTAGGSGVEMRIEDLDDPGSLRSELRRRISAVGSTGEDRPVEGPRIDPETTRRLVEEARRMREAATGIEEVARR